MTKKRHDAEIRVYLYHLTDDELVLIRDKIRDLVFETKDSEGGRIRSAVTIQTDKGRYT